MEGAELVESDDKQRCVVLTSVFLPLFTQTKTFPVKRTDVKLTHLWKIMIMQGVWLLPACFYPYSCKQKLAL